MRQEGKGRCRPIDDCWFYICHGFPCSVANTELSKSGFGRVGSERSHESIGRNWWLIKRAPTIDPARFADYFSPASSSGDLPVSSQSFKISLHRHSLRPDSFFHSVTVEMPRCVAICSRVILLSNMKAATSRPIALIVLSISLPS